jgi:poly(3-hydroxybutyrate) depolymerase
MKLIVICITLLCLESCSLSPVKDNQIDNRILKIDFKDRYYGLFVNQFCQQKNSKCPILFAFHGGGGEALKLDITTELVKLADQKNVVIVYPNASNNLLIAFLLILIRNILLIKNESVLLVFLMVGCFLFGLPANEARYFLL